MYEHLSPEQIERKRIVNEELIFWDKCLPLLLSKNIIPPRKTMPNDTVKKMLWGFNSKRDYWTVAKHYKNLCKEVNEMNPAFVSANIG